MRPEIALLLREIRASESADSFAVQKLTDQPSYYVGRDAQGRAALLIQSIGSGRSVPMQLAGVEARFAVRCQVAEPGTPEDTKTLSVILCASTDQLVESYFASILETFVSVLGPSPTTDQVGDAVDQLVELFQKLQMPPQRSVTGLLGEACIVLLASDSVAAVSSWRIDPDERFDFVAGNLRLDAKASSRRQRSHEVAFDQANPPDNTRALFASIWIEATGGGTSLSALLAAIEDRLVGHNSSIAKLRAVVADTLGRDLPLAMDFRFDLEAAKSSLSFYDAGLVPAIRPPLAIGVSGVRFTSDFGRINPENIVGLRGSFSPVENALLPLPGEKVSSI